MGIIRESIKTDSNTSSIRVLLFIALIACIGMGYLAILLDRDLTGTGILVGAILGSLGLTKGVQVVNEHKKTKEQVEL